jgi:hypothetical protein
MELIRIFEEETGLGIPMKDGEESVLDKGEESKFEIIKPM